MCHVAQLEKVVTVFLLQGVLDSSWNDVSCERIAYYYGQLVLLLPRPPSPVLSSYAQKAGFIEYSPSLLLSSGAVVPSEGCSCLGMQLLCQHPLPITQL